MKNIMRLSSSIPLVLPSPCPRLRLPSLFVTVAMLLLLLSIASDSVAGSATWKTNPGSNDWNTASNWTPPTVPNGPSDTATFATSNTTNVSISPLLPDFTEVNGIVFNAGGSPFTISFAPDVGSEGEVILLRIGGVGITNNSGITQNFVAAANEGAAEGQIYFINSATAGNMTAFTNNGASINFYETSSAGNGIFNNNSGFMFFYENSTAGNGTFINHGAELSGATPGITEFIGTSTAGNGTFTINGGAVSGAYGGLLFFSNSSSAGNGTFTTNGGTANGALGGRTGFIEASTAGNAILIANGGASGGDGGLIYVNDQATGGTARVKVFDNGQLDISGNNAPSVTIGSIEGTGNVFLGARNLIVGSNNLSTNFSGKTQDGGLSGGTGGSLTKIGTGKLVLSHRNTYTGGTTIKRGRLMVNNIGASGTGSGPVEVNGGRLGGVGSIAGAVTVGSGRGREAVLSPGYHHSTNPGTLTTESPLTFNSDATYEIEVNSSRETMDKVVALGVTINSGAQTLFADLGSGTFTVGSVFTVIDNTSASPIAGTFSNLPDGAVFTSNGNTYQVNYEGGDGNDLILTVVP